MTQLATDSSDTDTVNLKSFSTPMFLLGVTVRSPSGYAASPDIQATAISDTNETENLSGATVPRIRYDLTVWWSRVKENERLIRNSVNQYAATRVWGGTYILPHDNLQAVN